MKKLKILSTISFALIGGCAFVSIPLAITSCGKNGGGGDGPTPEPPEPIRTGCMDGTDWDGYISGTGTLTIVGDDDTGTAAITEWPDDYEANNLVIPEEVTDGVHTYKLTGINSSRPQTASDSRSLTGSLTIGNFVENIGTRAFLYCKGFNGTLTIGNRVKHIEESAFESTTFNGDLTIPDSVTDIGNRAFASIKQWDTDDHLLTIGNHVETIGSSAFQLTSISGYRFTGNLIIPDSVRSIGNYAFQYNRGITGNLIIGNSVTSIGGNAFEQVYATSLTLPDSLRQEGSVVSINCFTLRQLTTITGSFINSDFTLSSWNSSAFGSQTKISGTVTNNGGCTKEELLQFLKNKGLPAGWDVG